MPNIRRLQFFFTGGFSDKPLLIWLLQLPRRKSFSTSCIRNCNWTRSHCVFTVALLQVNLQSYLVMPISACFVNAAFSLELKICKICEVQDAGTCENVILINFFKVSA